MTRDKEAEKKAVVTVEADENGVEESRSARKTIERRVPRILGELSKTEREILTLWAKGDNLRTIAEKTGTPIATTAKRLTRVHKKLFNVLLEEVDEITGEMQRDREEIDRLKEETRSNISELQRMIAA